MLVKIVPKGKQSHSVYECDNYHIVHRPSEEAGVEPYEELVLNRGYLDANQTILNLGSGTMVYVMNDDGKTIDTYYI